MRAVLLLALVGGCSSNEDLCTDPQVANLMCLTVRVTGSVDGDTLDEMQVDSTYTTNVSGSTPATHRTSIRVDEREDLGQARLPVSFPIIFVNGTDLLDSSSRLIIVAKSSGVPVGIAAYSFESSFSTSAIQPRSHTKITAGMSKAMGSSCFDGNHTANDQETDVDCGGPYCPACAGRAPCTTPGCKCTEDSDCVSPLQCKFLSSTDTGTTSGNFCIP